MKKSNRNTLPLNFMSSRFLKSKKWSRASSSLKKNPSTQPVKTLVVELISASDIPVLDSILEGGKADPYVKISVSKKKRTTFAVDAKSNKETKVLVKSETKLGTLNPIWRRKYLISIPLDYFGFLYLDVIDWDLLKKDDYAGHICISLTNGLVKDKVHDVSDYLIDLKHARMKSFLNVKIQPLNFGLSKNYKIPKEQDTFDKKSRRKILKQTKKNNLTMNFSRVLDWKLTATKNSEIVKQSGPEGYLTLSAEPLETSIDMFINNFFHKYEEEHVERKIKEFVFYDKRIQNQTYYWCSFFYVEEEVPVKVIVYFVPSFEKVFYFTFKSRVTDLEQGKKLKKAVNSVALSLKTTKSFFGRDF